MVVQTMVMKYIEPVPVESTELFDYRVGLCNPVAIVMDTATNKVLEELVLCNDTEDGPFVFVVSCIKWTAEAKREKPQLCAWVLANEDPIRSLYVDNRVVSDDGIEGLQKLLSIYLGSELQNRTIRASISDLRDGDLRTANTIIAKNRRQDPFIVSKRYAISRQSYQALVNECSITRSFK